MLTVRNIFSNIQKGQSSLRVSAILRELNTFFKSVQGRIKIFYARAENQGTIVFLKIPSQKIPNFSYEVALYIDSQNRFDIDTEVKVFSNSPGFGYNFVYVFNQHGSLLYPLMYPKSFITMKPKMRNPLETVSFDKHVYAALKILTRKNLGKLIDQFKNTNEPDLHSFEEMQKLISTKKLY